MLKFIEGRAKARGIGITIESTHRVIAIFDASMVLFNAVVEVMAGPVS